MNGIEKAQSHNFRKTMVAIALVLGLLGLGPVASAVASEQLAADQIAQRLAEMQEGLTAEMVLNEATVVAEQTGRSRDELLRIYLDEAEESLQSIKEHQKTDENIAVRAVRQLPNSRNKGDVFVTPAKTLGFEHGHAGIYYTTSIIVEAPGVGKDSRSLRASKIRVQSETVLQSVGTSQANRNKAATYAQSRLRGKFYNLNFAVNKKIDAESMNCSQLVWAAYKAASGIDLDANGGFGVYPYDIRDSRWTSTYLTVR